MTRAQAEQKLSASSLKPLDRPVKVSYKDRTFTLTQKAAAIGINITGSVDKAMRASQDGDMFSRTWRNLRNEQLNQALAADVTYNKPAIDKLVRRVQKSLDRKPRDAQARPQQGRGRARRRPDGPAGQVQHARQGARDDAAHARQHGSREGQDHRRQAQVSTDQLAKKYPALLIVNRSTPRAAALQGPQAEEDVRDRGRQGRARDAGRPRQHPEQGHQPGLARAELRLGRRSRRQGDRGR